MLRKNARTFEDAWNPAQFWVSLDPYTLPQQRSSSKKFMPLITFSQYSIELSQRERRNHKLCILERNRAEQKPQFFYSFHSTDVRRSFRCEIVLICKQESPADAVKPARRKSMPKLLQFDVFRFILPNSITLIANAQLHAVCSVRLQAYIVIHSLKSGVCQL